MGYFQVRYDSRVINYDHRSFIRLATGLHHAVWQLQQEVHPSIDYFILQEFSFNFFVSL